MKNLFKLFAIATAMLLGLSSCEQEKLQPAGKTHTVSFVAEIPQTKTTATIVGDVVKYEWNALLDKDASKFHIWENGVAATEIKPEIIDGLMCLDVTFDGAAVENAEYTAYFNSGVQTTQNGSDTGYDQNSDVLVATAAQMDNGTLMLAFYRQVAFAKITLKGLTKGTMVGDIVVESSDATIAADYDRDNGLTVNPSSKITIDGAMSPINGGEAVVWLVTAPIENAHLKFTVTTFDDDLNTVGTYEKELSRELTLTQNDVKVMGIALAEKVEVPTDKELVFDFVRDPLDGWPTDYTTESGDYVYPLDNVNYTFNVGANTKWNTSGCYLLIKNGNKLGLPAIEGYRLSKVVGTLNTSGASQKSKISINDVSGNVVEG